MTYQTRDTKAQTRGGRVQEDEATTPARGAALARRDRTGLVALAVPDLEEPYFAELTGLLVRRAEARGLSILIQQTAGVHEREVTVANGVGLPPTDGLIHIPRSLTVADLTRRTSPGPLVLLGEHILSSPFSHVTIDNRAAAMAATLHLVERGCRRLAVVGPRHTTPSDAADRRVAGFRDAVQAQGWEVDSDLVGPVGAFTSHEGQRAMRTLLDAHEPPDGVLCSNDSVAFGVMRELHVRGLRVPEDVAVVGIDDVSGAEFATPSLSSVAPDKSAIVDSALMLLERQIAAPPAADVPVEQVVVGFTLRARESTAR